MRFLPTHSKTYGIQDNLGDIFLILGRRIWFSVAICFFCLLRFSFCLVLVVVELDTMYSRSAGPFLFCSISAGSRGSIFSVGYGTRTYAAMHGWLGFLFFTRPARGLRLVTKVSRGLGVFLLSIGWWGRRHMIS